MTYKPRLRIAERIKVDIMCGKEELDALAERISRKIELLGACNMHQQELAAVWGHADAKPASEYRMHLANFAVQYGFILRVDDNLQTASFRKSI